MQGGAKPRSARPRVLRLRTHHHRSYGVAVCRREHRDEAPEQSRRISTMQRPRRLASIAARYLVRRIRGRRAQRYGDAGLRQADDACIRDVATGSGALPPRSPWTRTRRPPARDRRPCRSCIREKQRRRADGSYPCEGAARRTAPRPPERPALSRNAARHRRIGGLYTGPRWTRSPRRASSPVGPAAVSIFAPLAVSRQYGLLASPRTYHRRDADLQAFRPLSSVGRALPW